MIPQIARMVFSLHLARPHARHTTVKSVHLHLKALKYGSIMQALAHIRPCGTVTSRSGADGPGLQWSTFRNRQCRASHDRGTKGYPGSWHPESAPLRASGRCAAAGASIAELAESAEPTQVLTSILFTASAAALTIVTLGVRWRCHAYSGGMYGWDAGLFCSSIPEACEFPFCSFKSRQIICTGGVLVNRDVAGPTSGRAG